jgi:phage terminase large subunit-like protein
MPPAPRKHGCNVPPAPEAHPHVAAAERYVAAVLGGEIAACKWVRLACERHRRDVKRAATGGWRYVFDPVLAEKACGFIELLPHIKGKWARDRQLLRLEPWQCFKTVSIFGWVDKVTRLRRFRRAMLLEPRKQAKSTWAAAIGLFMLSSDGEHGAEIYSGATSQKQAYEVFGPARLMALGALGMRRHFGMDVNVSNINILDKASKFEPLIGKPGDGASPSCAIVDEFHEHQTSDQYDTMLTGMGAREQPLVLVITTAGDNVSGPCYDLLLTLRRVLEGVIEDEEFFGLEYTIDDGDDWASPAVLRKANPNLGVSVAEDFLIARQAEAVRNPREQARFRTKHLNQWISARSAFFNMAAWAACRNAPPLDEMEDGADVIIAADLASKLDIAAIELLFPQPGGRFVRHGLHYLPSRQIEDPAKEHYAAWAIAGDLVVTDGDITDYHRIRDDIVGLSKRFRVLEFVYDPHQATMLVTELQELGLECVEYPMTVLTMSEPLKMVDAAIVAGRLAHDCGPSHPMTWQMSNVVAKIDAKDNVYPRKERPELKIDGPVALTMAMGRAMMLEIDDGVSPYETRGLLVL